MKNRVVWQLSAAISLALSQVAISTVHNYTLAQPLADDSLGTENTLVIQQTLQDFLIEGGASRGSNLFHSFQEFNVGDGGSVFFANPEGILNILTRVTGGNPSDILGTLGVNGGANLFLLNPNGIFFGENAQLSLTGSFLATTADSFVFADGFEFSASNPQAPPLLTVNIPIGLRFRDNPGNITVDRSVLEVNQGESLSLIGGNVNVSGTLEIPDNPSNAFPNSGILAAPGGTVNLGGLTTAGDVQINPDLSLVFPENIAKGDVIFTNANVQTSLFEENQGNAGTINVNSNLFRLENSFLQSNLEDQSQGNAGVININANAVELIGALVTDDEGNQIGIGSGIQARVSSDNQGLENSDGGQINILADSVLVQDSQIEVSTGNNSLGNAGNILIDTPETGSVELRSTGNNFPRTQINIGIGSNSTGNAGRVEIKTGSLTLESQTRRHTTSIQSSIGFNSVAPDNAGTIIIEAVDRIDIIGDARLETTIRGGGEGNAGTININTATFVLDGDRARIKASLNGTDDFRGEGEPIPTRGTAGDLIVNANSIELKNGANFQLNSQRDSEGIAGNIKISTDTLTLTGGSYINTSTNGIGDAGTIEIEATESITVSGVLDNQNIFFIDSEGEVVEEGEVAGLLPPSRIESTSVNRDDGQAGQITIKTPNLRVENGGLITTNTRSTSDGGNIVINGEVLELIDGGQITARARSQGNAGSIDLNISERITISGSDPQREIILQELINNLQDIVDNGDFPEDTDVELVAEEAFFTINDRSGIFGSTDANAEGDGGAINLNSASIFMSNSGTISAVSEGSGSGGNILVEANNLTLLNQATIEASTRGAGNAGNIELTVDNFLLIDGENTGIFGTADANSTGNGGTIKLYSNNLTLLNQATIEASTEGIGNAGNINLTVADLSLIDGEGTGILGNAEVGSTGDGGTINLNSASLIMSDRGTISAVSEGSGSGGDIVVEANNLALFNQATIEASTQRTGDGGSIELSATDFILIDGEGTGIFGSAGFDSEGNGGTINLNSPSVIMSDHGTISAVSEGSGSGGNIVVEANDLALFNQATIEASTQGAGNAGNIKLTVADSILIDGEGTGIFGNGGDNSTGIGGSINIDPESVLISNGGIISVSNTGTGAGGNILLIADNLTLDDGEITAGTNNAEGGDITLEIADILLLRDGSLISAEASEQGNGGNVNISTQFLVAFPQQDSNISANASQGDGGNVDITARRIYGIQFRQTTTNLSDITASSDFGLSGTVTINQPDVEPERGVIELPEEVVDQAELVAQNACQLSGGSQFAATGRGGLPATPNDAISSDNVRVDLVEPVPSSTSNTSIDIDSLSLDEQGKPIIPAQGWIFTDDGKVLLVAYNPAESQRVVSQSDRCTKKQ